jgi:hypothetical protein
VDIALTASRPTPSASVFASGLFWAVIAVVVAIVVPVALYLIGRTKKALAYETSATPMVSPWVHEAFEISFQGTRVRSVHLVEVDIKNVGNAPIRSGDYETPLRVVCEGTVLSARSSRGGRRTSIRLWPSELLK